MIRNGLPLMFLVGIFLTFAGGCSVPPTLNVYAVDALSGHPVSGVQVERARKNVPPLLLGGTNGEGHLDELRVERGDRLTFSHPAYEMSRLLIDYNQAVPLPPVNPPAGDERAAKADRPIIDADPLSYPPDRTLTIVLHPK